MSQSRLTLIVSLFAALVLTATACAPTETATKSASTETSTPADTSIASEQPGDDDTAPAEEETTPADDGPASFGEKYTYEDGLEVTITKISRHTFSDYSAGYKPGDVGIAFTVKLTNKTGATIDPSLCTIEVVGGPDGESADDVFDSGNGFDGGFEAKLTDGHKASGRYGFAFPKGTTINPVQIQVAPTFDYQTVIFEGRVS